MNYCNNLQCLLAPWVSGVPECFFRNLIADSRFITLNDVFFALDGHRTDGANYILNAIVKGAMAVVTHCQYLSCCSTIRYFHGVPIIYLYELHRYLSAISGRFFNHPSKFFRLIGVTGTNGKSTVAHLLSNWVYLLDEVSAIIGTLGNGIIGRCLHASVNTTCSAIDTQRMLSSFKEYGVTFTAIEVSSHGLVENRVDNLYFDVAVFTNLTRDHLDYHNNFFQYELAKWRLFNDLQVRYFVLNYDDIIGKKWLLKLSNAVAVTMYYDTLPFGSWQGKWLCASKISYCLHYTKIKFNSSWGNGIIRTQLIGKCNVINLLLAMAVLLVLKYPLSMLLNTVGKLRPIPGRMDLFCSEDHPRVVVDYAHTPEALKQALITSRLYSRGKICCVFGCGGERDKGKRSLMGLIAKRYADNVIVTNDNPRSESPYDIIHDIMKGLSDKTDVQIITSRYKAILTAINQHTTNDLVLIAGKGHENYQIIGDQKFNYSDLAVVKQLLFS